MDSKSIRVRVALKKARESQEITRDVVEAALELAKKRVEQAVQQ
jgi:hypothetical protein